MKKSRKFIVIILMILLSVAVTRIIGNLHVLPTKYFNYFIITLASINFIGALGLLAFRRGFMKFISFLMFFIINLLAVGTTLYGPATNKFFNEGFGNADETYQTSFYIISKNNILESELTVKTIAYYQDIYKKDDILKKLNSMNIMLFKEELDLDTVFTHDVILLDNATYTFLKENNGRDINSYNVIVKVDVDIVLDNSAIGEEDLDEYQQQEYQKLTPGEYYNIFIGGYDFTNTFMDFNMLVSINKTNQEILLTTIPRDYYITDARVGKRDKLSDMGARGIETNIASVAKLFGIKIDYYIQINTRSLVELVNAVGGITYCSDQEYTTTHSMVLNSYNDNIGEKLHVKKGCQYLNGIQTLTVARERLAFKSGDNQRQKNCAQIMKAILNKMKTPAMIIKFPNILNAVSGFYSTTIPRELVTSSVQELLENPNWVIKTQSVTGSGGQDYIFFGSTKDYVMYPNMSSVNNAKYKIQGMKYKKLNQL